MKRTRKRGLFAPDRLEVPEPVPAQYLEHLGVGVAPGDEALGDVLDVAQSPARARDLGFG